MRQIVSTVTSKGQVTIPADVRKHLGIKQGDKLSFVIRAEHECTHYVTHSLLGSMSNNVLDEIIADYLEEGLSVFGYSCAEV